MPHPKPATNIGKYMTSSTADIIHADVDPAKTARSVCGRQPELGGPIKVKTGSATSFRRRTGREAVLGRHNLKMKENLLREPRFSGSVILNLGPLGRTGRIRTLIFTWGEEDYAKRAKGRAYLLP
jgi:hypothetical protein